MDGNRFKYCTLYPTQPFIHTLTYTSLLIFTSTFDLRYPCSQMRLSHTRHKLLISDPLAEAIYTGQGLKAGTPLFTQAPLLLISSWSSFITKVCLVRDDVCCMHTCLLCWNWLFILPHPSGSTCYTTYNGIFVTSSSDCSVFPGTSVQEIASYLFHLLLAHT